MIERNEFGSSLFSLAVEALMGLPGVGQQTAQRYALYLHSLPAEAQDLFLESLELFLRKIQYCPDCHAFSDTGQRCAICSDAQRDDGVLCVVASMEDMLVIERMGHYRGKYFILGGLIDPLVGVGPDQLPLEELVLRVEGHGIQEVIFAFNSTPAGETTSFYLQRLLAHYHVVFTEPGRGIPVGEHISRTDDQTLYRAFSHRRVLESLDSEVCTANTDLYASDTQRWDTKENKLFVRGDF